MRNKKVKGFTLIELIVVIAIIAVLAAILIPSLMGWVGKSSLRTANTNAKAVATNAASVLADLETQGQYVTDGDYTANTDTPSADSAWVRAEVSRLAGFDDDNVWGFVYSPEDEAITYAFWQKAEGSPYIGTYPKEATGKNGGGGTENP